MSSSRMPARSSSAFIELNIRLTSSVQTALGNSLRKTPGNAGSVVRASSISAVAPNRTGLRRRPVAAGAHPYGSATGCSHRSRDHRPSRRTACSCPVCTSQRGRPLPHPAGCNEAPQIRQCASPLQRTSRPVLKLLGPAGPLPCARQSCRTCTRNPPRFRRQPTRGIGGIQNDE